jgi:ABC-2 type transport system ATP-binding protein
MKAISPSGVSKNYDEISALSNLSLEVESGEVLCLLGPNGAGKSTALNLMLGLIKPDRHTIEVFVSSSCLLGANIAVSCDVVFHVWFQR